MIIHQIVGGFWSGVSQEVADGVEPPAGWTQLPLPAGDLTGRRVMWMGGIWNALPPGIVPPIDAAREAKNIEINDARLLASRATFPYGGKLFACDELARSDIDGTNGIVALTGEFPPAWPGVWKAEDNTYIQMETRAQWESFYRAMAAHGTANFIHAQQLKYQLEQATTIEQIAAITW